MTTVKRDVLDVLDVLYKAEPGDRGQWLDVHMPAPAPSATPVVLLWHGSGRNEKDVLVPLAQDVARYGVLVFVPDWRPDAQDRGRADLLASLRYVRDHAASFGGDPARIALAGWSAGAGAAVGMALAPEPDGGWRPSAAVGISGRYDMPARSTGSAPLSDLERCGLPPVPIHLVHGVEDAVLSSRHSHDFHIALQANGWPAHLVSPATDHAGVVMTEYDPEQGRCRPARTDHAMRAGRATAGVIARAAREAAGGRAT
ncbi:carboxylesterase family protein [Streptomyces sp. RB6PN25]|uniref:Carboxylic ester hydrolase n=1 Tax=Streptomyces humicola TaxID=2953240 RepID=A0ABT1PYQ6_9ACTN|nr:carboxylesterase family protein [Streptomyces humicola]MCQ4082813.1 carboxylesterase family protein [Streptomyces humicola]